MMARAGPGAAAYQRGSQTWSGTRPALTANPPSSSTSAVGRAAPPGTWANEASMIECDLVARSSRPASSAAPLTLPKAKVTWPGGTGGGEPPVPGGHRGGVPPGARQQVEGERQRLPAEQGGERVPRGHDHRDRAQRERQGG